MTALRPDTAGAAAPRRARRTPTAAALAGLAALALLPTPGPTAGQHADRPEPQVPVDEHGFPLVQATPSPFRLRGLADFALTGMRGRGSMRHKLPNDSPLDYYFVLGGPIMYQLGTPLGTQQTFFQGPLWAGTPRSEWNKHRQRVPSLNNVLGGGWTSQWNLNAFFLALPNSWRAADNQLGFIHSGASATNDGGCTDFTAENVATGAPLAAVSDCPATWGSDQFRGARRAIPLENWAAYFREVGPANFTWDWWRVPAKYVTNELLGDFQTYGKIIDWAADNLARYGSVIPGRTGAPAAQGFPLGLSVYYDAFSFALPAVANVTFWQAILVNESQQVYGVPLDYDSLYFGLEMGYLMGVQASASYFRPELGGVLTNNNGTNPACNGARTPAGVAACRFGVAGSGFDYGAAAILVLNSPIGDLRNKLFSDPTSPFYAPNHPNRGDTLTFNLGRSTDFGTWGRTTNRSARSGFGLHAFIPDDLLDGRSPAEFDPFWFAAFKNFDYPTRTPRFNSWAPGNWDWNKDGVPDTLFIDTCLGEERGGPPGGGCSAPWSDTLPGRLNLRGGNFGGFIGVGPFRLKAGDTTKFTVAIMTAPTRADIEATVRNTIAFYQAAFLRPRAPTPPRVIAVNASPGDRGRADGAAVTIFLDDRPSRFVDEFLLFQAKQLEGSRLARDNPWLVDSIRAVARRNVAAVHVFKSCDNGTTFTADADCRADRALDDRGRAVKLGWRPLATFTPDANGRFANVFIDRAVTAGKRYLYSFVAESRGLTVEVVDRDINGNPVARRLELAPVLFNPLSTSVSDPNVASVYVPASRQAGGRIASVEFTQDDPVATVRFHPVTILLTGEIARDAGYRLVFGDSVVVTSHRDEAAGSAADTVRLFRTVRTSLDGQRVVRLAYDAATYTTTNPAGVDVAGGVTTTTDLGSGRTRTTTVFGNVLTLVALDDQGRPLFASSVLDGRATTPGTFFGRPDFPRWVAQIDNTRAGTLLAAEWVEPHADSLRALRAGGSPNLTWRAADAQPTGESYGEYQIEFVDEEFGPGHLFRVDMRNPANTEAALKASLERRAVATTTATTEAVARALGVPASDLAAVKLPFRVRQTTSGREVTVAILKANKLRSMSIGSGLDRITVAVPEDQWIPGDRLVFLETIRTFRRARTASGEVYTVTQNGQPVPADTLLVTWRNAVLGCPDPTPSCNPVPANTPGASPTGHLTVDPGAGQRLRVRYLSPLTVQSAYAFTVHKTITGTDIVSVDRLDLENIKVVPNPYVVFSRFEQANADRRLMFIGLPPQGTIHIFTVSGQLVQRIEYGPEDLAGNGDLYWNMRTRENTDLASGLYVFVVEGRLPGSGQTVRKVGKFVVIR